MIRPGPAGWSYKDWAGVVYPQPTPRGFDPLAFLAGYFETIEINSTYYRPASKDAAVSWARRVASNRRFRFTVKLWGRFTHERDAAFTRTDVRAVRQSLDPLAAAHRLGAVLLQFPWSFRRTDDNRAWLDDVTRAFQAFPLALEVRHESWNVPEFYEELVERGIGFVNIDQPLFRHSIRPSARATSRVGYVRVHGRNYRDWFRKNAGVEARYDYLYSPPELEPWAERAREVAGEARDTFVITNNHYRGQAVVNALQLKSMLGDRAVSAPSTLFETYGRQLEGYAAPARTAAMPKHIARLQSGSVRRAARRVL
jgi:uncharacterized protein YecE (DUF72 family)